jgi:hypothetical protein
MIIESKTGKGIPGTISESPTKKSKRIGVAGKRTIIGRSKILGVCKICHQELIPDNSIGRFNHNPEK